MTNLIGCVSSFQLHLSTDECSDTLHKPTAFANSVIFGIFLISLAQSLLGRPTSNRGYGYQFSIGVDQFLDSIFSLLFVIVAILSGSSYIQPLIFTAWGLWSDCPLYHQLIVYFFWNKNNWNIFSIWWWALWMYFDAQHSTYKCLVSAFGNFSICRSLLIIPLAISNSRQRNEKKISNRAPTCTWCAETINPVYQIPTHDFDQWFLHMIFTHDVHPKISNNEFSTILSPNLDSQYT